MKQQETETGNKKTTTSNIDNVFISDVLSFSHVEDNF